MPLTINLDDCVSPTARLFGERLKQRRGELRITQQEICLRTGVAPDYVSQIERARANPTLELMEKIAHAVGLERWAMIRPDSQD